MRNSIGVGALVLAACSGAARPGTPGPGSGGGVPTYQFACGGGTREPVDEDHRPKTKIYDFNAVTLPRTSDGPRFADSSVSWPARTPSAMHSMVMQGNGIRDCWQWASVEYKLGETGGHVELDVNPWGQVSNVHAEVDGVDELARCLEEQIDSAHAGKVATQPTHLSFDLRFVLADQQPWLSPPGRPETPEGYGKIGKSSACVPVIDGRVDQITLASPLVISDGSTARDYHYTKNGHLAVEPHVGLTGYCNLSRPELDKTHIRRAMRSNMGAFGACHADARGRDPALAGTTTLTMHIHSDGFATTEVSGDGDQPFHDCLKAATDEIWFGPNSMEIDVTWPFTLEVAEEEASEPTPTDECGRLDAAYGEALERAPWLYDPAVLDAIDALVAGRCVEAVEGALQLLIRHGRDIADVYADSYRENLDLIERVMPLADRIGKPGELRMLHAYGTALADPAAAIAELRAIGSVEAIALADQLTAEPDIRGTSCW
jgi:hypothetical protein